MIGLDTDPAKIESLNLGRSYIEDVTDSSLAAVNAPIIATHDYAELTGCDAIIVCVPTPLTGSREPDLSYLEAAADHIATILQPGQLVIHLPRYHS